MSGSNLSISVENDQLILLKVSLNGDVAALMALLQEDELVLDRNISLTAFNETPLHIAAMRGHLEFTVALLRQKPKLADKTDALHRLPLHLAAEEGYIDIVKELIRVNPDACSARDQDGRLPLHLAVIKERIDVIEVLMKKNSESVKKKLDHEGTILHLCVKYNRLEALKLLVEKVRDDINFVNASDCNGNTILHLSAILKQVQMTKYLLREARIELEINALNKNNLTALDAAEYSGIEDSKSQEIKVILVEAGATKKNLPPPKSNRRWCCIAESTRIGRFFKAGELVERYFKNAGELFEKSRGDILIAATVTASITFQAGINPPSPPPPPPPQDDKMSAGPPVSYFSEKVNDGYIKHFWHYNSISLWLSLALILLMLSGIPLKNKIASACLAIAMCTTVFYISKTYFMAAMIRSQDDDGHEVSRTIRILFQSIIGLHLIFLGFLLLKKMCDRIYKRGLCSCRLFIFAFFFLFYLGVLYIIYEVFVDY